MPYSYRELSRALRDAGIEEAKDEAALLLQHFCGANRMDCLTDPDRAWSGEKLEQAVARRLTRYPLQYILGQWEFFGCSFKVNEHCLIPRPDTEILVERAVKAIPKGATVIDLCTGSGCIAITLLKARPDVRAIALELYPDTLAIATENACLNGVEDRFIPLQADLLNGGAEKLSSYAPLDAILSNPPYIPAKVVDGLAPELFFEPRAALDGGEDGLIFYRAILQNYLHLLKPNGYILLEIGYDQAADLTALAQKHAPAATVTVHRDLGGNDRVVELKFD